VRSFRHDPHIGEYEHIRKLVDILEKHGIPLEMSLRELRVLNAMTLCFLERDQVTQSEIVAITGLSKATVSRYVLNWLILGWLTESIDATDRRRRPLSLTESAKKISQSLTSALAAISSNDRGPEPRRIAEAAPDI
jgi:DNA-binding MarR family transcriptional regulator